MSLSVFVERLRASARKKRLQFQKAVSNRPRYSRRDRRHETRDRVQNECDIDIDTAGKTTRSSTLLSDDRSFTTTASSIASNSIITTASNSERHSLGTTSEEGEPGSPRNFYRIIKRKPIEKSDTEYSHASTATLTADHLNDLESAP